MLELETECEVLTVRACYGVAMQLTWPTRSSCMSDVLSASLPPPGASVGSHGWPGLLQAFPVCQMAASSRRYMSPFVFALRCPSGTWHEVRVRDCHWGHARLAATR